MRDLILRFFGQKGDSSNDAKSRLKFLLVHDEVELTPVQLENMKEEIMQVIARYVDVDVEGVDFRLDKSDGHIALISNVPVKRTNARV
jgi:cell division topological specificity factor